MSKDYLPQEFVPRRFMRSRHDANEEMFMDGSMPLFDISRYTKSLERGAALMHEVRAARGQQGPMHIFIGAEAGAESTRVDNSWR